MRTSHWIGGGLLVLIVLILTLTVDPLGLMTTSVDDADVIDDTTGENRSAGGLKGRGKRVLPDADPKSWEGEPVGRLVLSLGKGELSGTVTSGDQPLRFARVRVALPEPYGGMGVRTTKEGAWAIAGLPAGTFDVRASAPEHVGRSTTAPPLAPEQAAVVPAIDLMRRTDNTAKINVRVTDAFGRPLAGARVLATTMPWDLHMAMGPELAGVPGVMHKSGTTDEGGKVTLGPLAPEDYGVVAMAPGYINSGVDRVSVTAGRDRTLGMRLVEGVSVRGRVLDTEGNGIEGAMVMGFAQPSFASSLTTTTGADGSFTLSGLRTSDYLFVAFAEKYGTAMVPGKSPGSLDIKLSGAGTVVGEVVWADGEPVTKGKVRPFQIGPFQYVYSQVHDIGDDGTFTFDVPAGQWNCRVQAADGTMRDGTMVTVSIGEKSEVSITLHKSGVVKGVVTDEAGNHVSGAEVFVMQGGFPQTPSREQYARTSADGVFEVKGLALANEEGEPIGPIDFHVRHADFADTKVRLEPALPDAAKEQTVRMRRGASVVGKVTDSEGTGIAGEQVNLAARGEFFEARSTFTNDDGAYRFDAVAPGTYMVTTGPFEQGARGLSKSDIGVGEEGDVSVNFVNPAAGGVLSGLVEMAGKPVPGAKVTVVDARGPERAIGATTDENGRFKAAGIQFGRVRVTAKTPAGMTGDASLNIDEGAPAEVTVDIGSATVSARILDAAGEPAAGCWINIELVGAEDQGWGRVKDNGNTGSDGVYQSKGLQPGTYTVRVNRVDLAQFVSEPFRLAEGEAKNLGDLRMVGGVILQGVVRDDAGAPVEKATVSLRDMQGRAVQLFSMATTGSDGRFAMHSVEPGRYVAVFQATGHATAEQEIEITDAGGTANAVVTRGGTVRIEVVDQAGEPVPGVNVKLYDAKGLLVTRTISLANFDSGRRFTDGAGSTSLDDLAAGAYEVRVSLEGWSLVGNPGRARVEPGAVATVKLVMEKAE